MRARVAVVLFGLLAAAASCSSKSSGGGAPPSASDLDGGTDDAGGATFTTVYTSILEPKCTPCHATGAGATDGKLDMSSQAAAYSNLVNVPATGSQCSLRGMRVDPGKPETSILHEKLATDTPLCGDRMPQGLPPLSSDQIATLDSWILDGAQRN